uniref:Uncharacterized protein n=1 Tax=Pseudomonas putida TaxID=303 RepID=A0A6B7PWK5_PSEPU|nr:hypothetical protein [Pseudomonas putida]
MPIEKWPSTSSTKLCAPHAASIAQQLTTQAAPNRMTPYT